MKNSDPMTTYLRALQRTLSTGAATERSHYSALKTLLEATGNNVQAINEPKRIDCGAPDFIIYARHTPIGYVEAKDVGTNLDAAQKTEQIASYRASLNNLILTDYLEFRWFVQGECNCTARLAALSRDSQLKRVKGGAQAVLELLQNFFAHEAPSIGRPKDLAQRMAALARMIHNLIVETFKREPREGTLHAQLQAFRQTLISLLTPEEFADMYAQTITYGLFAARLRVPTGLDFTREKAAWNLPKTNPFLRKLFNEIAGADLDPRIAWLVDDLAYLLARADMAEVLRDFGKRTRREDPVVHFYETFLAAYDPKERERRGVYYTPEPVVSYIVRSLDHILKTHFERAHGLADTNTLILDPAVGTGTFLYFVMEQIHQTLMAMRQAGAWNDYVKTRLLPRVFGFELLMAPYAVAHMKLGILLQETGYDFSGDQRLGIYLTNSLEEAIVRSETLGFAEFIAEEANAAQDIKKEKPIMVVLGNPPYSVSSVNKGEHIEHLMERYKAAVRKERNIQPLSDDYIKFIRFAHDRIERTGYGVIGMITNHSYLSGLIHRGMREELTKSFDEIYVLNLHGNALLRETAPDGSPDENVFDIRQGVAIAIFVKKPEHGGAARVYYADLWGLRQDKHDYLLEKDVTTTDWHTLDAGSPHFFFVPKDLNLFGEYERGWSVADIFPVNSSGIKTHRDHFVIDFDEKTLRSRIAEFRDEVFSDDEVRERFKLKDGAGWKVAEARAQLQARGDWSSDFHLCLYRPFDMRSIYYSDDVIERPRPEVMRHMLQENIGLVTVRQLASGSFQHVFVTRCIGDGNAISLSTREYNYYFPLYLYDKQRHEKRTRRGGGVIALTLFDPPAEYVTRKPNISAKFIAAVDEKLRLEFVSVGQGDLKRSFGPEDIFYYAYAVFHSPTYRTRYAEFLKIDFPRLPLTSDRKLFKALAKKGEELVSLHLTQSPKLSHYITDFPVTGSNGVEKVRYAEPRGRTRGRVFINKTQYFDGIEPELWQFHIGGYQVLEKWLKDRKGRALSSDDIFHYQKIVVALTETIRLMNEIDRLIPSWPIE